MWIKNNIPSQEGKVAVVTGANSGIGYETALALYEKGANVILACRDIAKAEEAKSNIEKQQGSGSVEILKLDLADLESVKQAAETFKLTHSKLDILVNNAGVMVPPASVTAQGWELQFGANVLGHFAFTGLLFPLLKNTPASRVVTVSSLVYRLGAVDYDNLKLEKDYNPDREYAQSKFANLLFTVELARKVKAANLDVISAASHPGVTGTNLARHIGNEAIEEIKKVYGELMEPWQGALPSLYAATASDIQPGDFLSPNQDGGLRGYPYKMEPLPQVFDEAEADKLWKFSEEVTGVKFL